MQFKETVMSCPIGIIEWLQLGKTGKKTTGKMLLRSLPLLQSEFFEKHDDMYCQVKPFDLTICIYDVDLVDPEKSSAERSRTLVHKTVFENIMLHVDHTVLQNNHEVLDPSHAYKFEQMRNAKGM